MASSLTAGEVDRDTCRQSGVPTGAPRGLRPGLGQPLNSLSEAGLVLDVVSRLSKAGGRCFVLSKSEARKKIKKKSYHSAECFVVRSSFYGSYSLTRRKWCGAIPTLWSGN